MPDTPSASTAVFNAPEVTICTMGWTPGDRYCDLCGETVKQYNELVTLKRDSREGGSADICRACVSRPIAALLARMDDPMPRRPVRRSAVTRRSSLLERLFG